MLLFILGVLAGALLAGLWFCLLASLWHFRWRRRPAAEPRAGMTLIRPVRGLDEALEDGFESIVASDPEGRLQFIIAIESEDDPAYPVALAFARRHPGRDILILTTGPSGERMGKIHNMIEALPKAKHPFVIFSDADCRATPGLLRQTALAFEDGCDMAFALPYHVPASGVGGFCFQIAFNHFFCVGAVLGFYLDLMPFCAGAWMAYRREWLERLGGLEPFAHVIADDVALSVMSTRLGAKRCLLGELVSVQESETSIKEAFEHLVKWSAIVRWCLPRPYLLSPFINPGLAAALFWVLCEHSGKWFWPGRAMLLSMLASRALIGYAQDRWVAGFRQGPGKYFFLAFADFGALLFWILGFRRTISWRGKAYRLSSGGRAKVIAPIA
ncbi:MAG: glycosyltransferase [Elusimicrobia bacterium]|nr:glycosyltransferase [Elusimicrobiota bacterium]